jgi:Fe-S-cluster containining protein
VTPDQLIADLQSEPGYATGRRAYPRTVTLPDTLAVVARLFEEVDRGVAARAEAARRGGVAIACRRGCNACCAEPIMVLVPTAIAVASWLAEPAHAGERSRFLAAYPAWREAVGDGLDRLAELTGGPDREAQAAAHTAHQRRRILCPFNHEGDCGIYPVRPTVCRNAHAVDTADYCAGDHPSGKAATRLAFVPLDELLRHVRRTEQALHFAIGARQLRLTALPDLVHTLLTGAGPSP